MENYQKTIKSKFSFLSKFYDIFEAVFIFNKKTNPRYGLAEKIPDENLRILDICVGTANSSIMITRKNPKNEIIGIDLSPDMIAVAENKIRKQKLKNIHLQLMDATQMTFQDSTFDIATVSFGLHELNYELMIKILEEMLRVLKNEGKIYIIDYGKQSNPIKIFLLSVFLKIFEPKHMSQFLKYDWENILGSLGFENIKIEKYLFSKLILANKSMHPTFSRRFALGKSG